jgi:predicted SAM-dependent methyltransferase
MLRKLLLFFGLLSVSRRVYLLIKQIISYPKWIVLKKSKHIYLEIGSGSKKSSNNNKWTTVDLYGADIIHDLRKGIPLPDNSVDQIYASHLFEHIPFKDLIVLLNEIYRVLKNDGSLSVCVPDSSLYIKSYLDGKNFFAKEKAYQPAVIDTGSLMDQINYIAYMDQQHKFMFDKENLINILKKIPFKIVNLRDFDESLDMKSRDFESIYAIAIK